MRIALLQTVADEASSRSGMCACSRSCSFATEELGRQTATAEILRVMRQSQTELQPVNVHSFLDPGSRLQRLPP